MKTNSEPRIVAYLRVSTDEQKDSGHGLNAQEDACRRYGEVDALFTDAGVSGAAPLSDRPGLLMAIDSLAKGDTLIVAKRDRLGRDPIVVAMIEAAVSRKGAKVASAAGEGTDGDQPTDVLMRRIVDAFAEYERLVLRARTKAALRAKSDRGERVGRVPFGYRLADDRVKLVKDETEQQILRSIVYMHEHGVTWRDIAIELGTNPRTGGKWNHSQLMRLTRLNKAAEAAEGEGNGKEEV